MVYIDPYQAESYGIQYKNWRLVIDNQNLDPYFCESMGIPYQEWQKLIELNQEK